MDQASKRETSPAKRHRGPDKAPSSASAPRAGVARVLDVEMLLHNVLWTLDAPSIASLVEVLAGNRQWYRCLHQPALWDKLLLMHFGGRRVVDNDPDVSVANNRFANAFFLVDPDESDDEGDGEEDEGNDEIEEEEEEEEEDQVPELITVDSADSSEEEVGVVEDDNADEGATVAGNAAASTAHDVNGAANAPAIPADATPSAETPVASPLVLSLACEGLKEFLLSAEEWKRFQENVLVVQGDIGEITELGGRAIDGIAFPTTPYMRNPHIGSAAVVHRRAGDGLATHIRGLNVGLNVSEVHVTPGFDAGVDKLIHVVGPSASDRQCYQLLQLTYKNIMLAARRENLQCLALTSISTGNLGVPCKEGARMALRAIQRFLSQEKWSGVVGVVCFDPEALDAFTQEKKALVDAFNVVPPYPEPSREML